MASLQTALAEKPAYSPPPIDGDFYRIVNVLDERERALITRVRAFTEGVVAPIIEDYWGRDEFPFEIIPKMAEVGIGGVASIRRLRRSGACIQDSRQGRSTCAATRSRNSVGCLP